LYTLPSTFGRVWELSQVLQVVSHGDRILQSLGSPRAGLATKAVLQALHQALKGAFSLPVAPSTSEGVMGVEALEVILQPSAWDPEELDVAAFAERARTLLIDVIRRASHDWVLYRTSRRMDQRDLAHEAYVWLFEEDEDHPWTALRKRGGTELTSFLSICEIIDVDPDFARAQIRKLTVRDVKMAGRPPDRRHRQGVDTTYYVEHSVLTDDEW